MALCRLIQDADRKETARGGLQPPHATATEVALTPFRPILTASHERVTFSSDSHRLASEEELLRFPSGKKSLKLLSKGKRGLSAQSRGSKGSGPIRKP